MCCDRISRERTAETLNCSNYSYIVKLSLVKSRYYSVFLLPFCGEIKLCTSYIHIVLCPLATNPGDATGPNILHDAPANRMTAHADETMPPRLLGPLVLGLTGSSPWQRQGKRTGSSVARPMPITHVEERRSIAPHMFPRVPAHLPPEN